MNFTMNLLDISLVGSYLVFCLVIGFIKLDKVKNLKDYALGAKPFSTAVLIATTFATAISAHKTIGSVGKSYDMGISFVISMFMIPVGWFIMAKLLSRNYQFFKKQNFLTLGDIVEHWYGKTGRWITTIGAIGFTLGMTAVSSKAIGILLNYFFEIDEDTGVLVGLAIVTLYSAFGGLQSVAFTDVFQFLIFFIALPIACAIGFHEVGGISKLWSALPSSHNSFATTDWSVFIGMSFFALMPNADIPFIQRALASRNGEQLEKTFNTVAILMFPLFAVIALIGLITYVKSPGLSSDNALFYFVNNYLPSGIVGLMIAGIMAVIMSTQDSFLNTTSVLIARDVFKQLFPNLTDKKELIIARLSCVGIALASVSLLFIKKDIIELIWSVCNFWDPLVIVPLIGGLIGLRINKSHFIVVPVVVLFAEFITRLYTGSFDTRSFAVGVITSILTILILHFINKKKS